MIDILAIKKCEHNNNKYLVSLENNNKKVLITLYPHNGNNEESIQWFYTVDSCQKLSDLEMYYALTKDYARVRASCVYDNFLNFHNEQLKDIHVLNHIDDGQRNYNDNLIHDYDLNGFNDLIDVYKFVEKIRAIRELLI